MMKIFFCICVMIPERSLHLQDIFCPCLLCRQMVLGRGLAGQPLLSCFKLKDIFKLISANFDINFGLKSLISYRPLPVK